ncbi:MAG: tricarballylate utilization 4Fe-4S protein TcuB [Quisquiliibacterium sp.]
MIDKARRDVSSASTAGDPQAEVARVMQICNACRYCEGFCAVFPAMTRRLQFGAADVHYLANLCHNCGACLHACQYAPPNDFNVNVPRAMAQVRLNTYSQYAFPAALGGLYRRAGLTVSLALAAALALFLVLAAGSADAGKPLAGNFYAIFPHNLLVLMFGSVFGWSVLALALGVRRFWRETNPAPATLAGSTGARTSLPDPVGQALAEATGNALTLKYLDGGTGEGCNDQDDRPTLLRRTFHHFTFYGFLLCFASTSIATVYHYGFGWQAPYALTSLPVILGTVGGVGLLIGPIGLAWLHAKRDQLHGDKSQSPLDLGFIALLFLVSLTGLALLAWRDSAAMSTLLAVHLGTVMALFITLPYGKFAHGVFRAAALLKWSIERRQPSNLKLGGD